MQIEIDSRIIDADILKRKLIDSAQANKIPMHYISEGDDFQLSAVSIPQIRDISLQMDRRLMELNNDWQIHELPITSHRPVIGKFLVFAKKTFRKLTRWLFSAYYEQESKFNYEVVQCLSEVHTMQKMIIKYLEQENE